MIYPLFFITPIIYLVLAYGAWILPVYSIFLITQIVQELSVLLLACSQQKAFCGWLVVDGGWGGGWGDAGAAG